MSPRTTFSLSPRPSNSALASSFCHPTTKHRKITHPPTPTSSRNPLTHTPTSLRAHPLPTRHCERSEAIQYWNYCLPVQCNFTLYNIIAPTPYLSSRPKFRAAECSGGIQPAIAGVIIFHLNSDNPHAHFGRDDTDEACTQTKNFKSTFAQPYRCGIYFFS